MEFVKVKPIVKVLLENKPECRDSDEVLYYNILKFIGFANGEDILDMPVGFFLMNMHLHACPNFETVRRTRQKVQAECPELAASKSVQQNRREKEAEIRKWSKE